MDQFNTEQKPILFSCDLIQESKKHIHFLRELHKLGVTLHRPLYKSFSRYVDFWLPLVAETKNEEAALIPPADVAWLWHCHRLAPGDYERYVTSRFGKIIESVPAFAFQSEETVVGDESDTNQSDALRTIHLWRVKYLDEPFFIELHKGTEQESSLCCETLDSFDLLSSTQRQATFLWQVSGPRFQDLDFLEQAVYNYYKFLKLPVGHLPSVPTYQIDLMWHTHMLESLTHYNADCMRIRGHNLHHDDSLNDRTPGAKLDLSCQQTWKKWAVAYGGEEYGVSGGMYRGEPPLAFYDVDWDPSIVSDGELVPMLTAGSISSGTDAPMEWLSLNAASAPDGAGPPFDPARPKSFSKGVNNNEQRGKYVFGRGPKGVGYYHIYTKEAFQILLSRLRKKEQLASIDYHRYECARCMCFSSSLSPRQEQEKEQYREKWVEACNIRAFVEAKLQTNGPGCDVDVEVVKKFGGSEPNEIPGQQRNNDDTVYDRYPSYYPYGYVYLCNYGGCGGGAGSGGCGAGGCGAGGCGGGGCGGGGCGGGGCGGG